MTTHEAIILAGGLGTRLAGVIGDCPKAMAPVAGRPFLEWQLDYLIAQGITRVILSVGHLADRIIAHFGDRYRGVDVIYAREERPLGTGGALKAALARVEGPGAFALNGDTLLVDDLSPIEGADVETVVIAVRFVSDTTECGTLTLSNGRAVQFLERGDGAPGWANAGSYWLRRDTFAASKSPDSFSFERDFLVPQIPLLRPRAPELKGFFLDIGHPETYSAAQSAIPAVIAGLCRINTG